MPEPDREVAQLEEVFKQAPAFFAVLRGPNHVFERVNDAYSNLIGRRDVIGKPLCEAIPEIRGQGFIELLDAVFATGEPYIARAIRAQIVKTAGHAPEDIFVDLIYAPLRSSDGTVVGIIAHGSDVTEQVRAREDAEAAAEALAGSEEQFRALANLIPALAWMADSTGWIFWYNNRWYEYTGTTPQQMEGWGWQSVHDPEVLPSVMERWSDSISTGEPFEMEFPLRNAAGEFRWFLTRVAPVKDPSGKVTRWFGTNTDVQAQHEAAEAAHAANKAKSDFLAAMSHETRQPINATLSFIQLLEMGMYGEVSEEQKGAIERIRRNQEQLLAVITDILSFARLEAGRFELRVVPVNASDILTDLSPLVEPQVTGKGISLSAGCSDADAV
ncbi:MAG: PAS domain-containing protein, partial [Gemmatimonadota bacterium]|nr:PAS domain-containing protein [Gemmatimonadota bacterium]